MAGALENNEYPISETVDGQPTAPFPPPGAPKQQLGPGGGSPLERPDLGQPDPNVEMARKGFEKYQAKAEQDYEEGEKRLAPQREKLLGVLNSPVKAQAHLKEVQEQPKPEDYRKGAMEFAASMAVVGAIFGRGSRNAGNAALNAFAGAMKGWKEGNLEAYTQATKEWEEATKKTIENNNLELEKYRMVIEDKKLNIDQMSAALNVVSTETGNKVLFDQTMAKNFTGYLNTYDKMISSQERLKLALDKSQGLDEKSQAPLRAGVEEAIKNPDIVNKWDSAMYLRIKGYADTIGVKIPDQVSPKGSQPRSAPAMALQQFIEEKRKAGSEPTSQEIADFNAHQQGQLRATRDFATGKQGQQINSLNVGISHLETLRSLGDALKNGSVKRFNEIAQKWAEETGNPAPTNFDTAKDIVGAEVMKAIVVGGGGVTERNAIRDQFARAGSPAAIGGAIDTAEKLLAGQFVGLKRQYEQTTGQTDFDSRMTDEALSIYQKLSPAGGAASVSDGGKPKQVIQNGHTYDLQPDGSYK